MTPKFESGDRVRIEWPHHPVHHGASGRVTWVMYTSEFWYSVLTDGGRTATIPEQYLVKED